MARNWTPAQRSAINERSRTLLVSAAAGSGKTAVLTERIIRSLCDTESPTDISRLLVVTFTRAAAAEMRARIAKALGDAIALNPTNAALRRQLMLLGSAKISTIDSFYLDLVRANFESAGFSPTFRMADEGELLSLKRDAMNAAVDRAYSADPDFVRVADLFSDVRSEGAIVDKLLSIAEKLEKLPERYDILLRSAKENETIHEAPFDHPLGKLLFARLQKTAEQGLALYRAALETIEAQEAKAQLTKKFGDNYHEMICVLEGVQNAIGCKDLDRLATILQAPLTKRVGSHKMPDCTEDLLHTVEACKEFRDDWRKAAAALGPFNTQEIREGGAEAATVLRLLYAVLLDFDKAYTTVKREKEVAEFSDVSRAAYHLLVDKNGEPTPLATSLATAYDAVYIDEYQDVDAMQDATFRTISTPTNRFMVGDIKQSIYRFRGADPDVFASYRRAFPDLKNAAPQDTSATIFMSNCFRCDSSIIRFSNAVSGFLFSSTAESIGYRPDDDLVYSKDTDGEKKCTVLVIGDPEEDDKEQDTQSEGESDGGRIEDAEARLIVREIKRLLSGEKKADGTPITPRDIAVLSRGSAFAAPLAKYLRAEGIPVNDTSRENFFENPEVLCMYSLLATIDNPFRDVYLAAVLRSPFFGFTLEELVSVRSATDDSLSLYESLKASTEVLEDKALCHRIEGALERIEAYRTKAELLPVDKLLRYLYRDTAVLSFLGEGADPGNKNGQQNLLRLYEYARSFEAGGFKGLYRFVRYVEDLMQNDTQMPIPEGPRDAVSLITVHHSKGLEYPVCFLATTGKLFNSDDQKEQLLIDGAFGCGTRVPNVGAFSRANTFVREALKTRLKQLSLEEEMRVLYVAMTRARERLYVTAKPRFGISNMEKHVRLAKCPHTDYFALNGNSYIEWILTALARSRQNTDDFCEVRYVKQGELLATDTLLTPSTAEPQAEALANAEALREEMAERFDFTYPGDHLSRLPAKLSVSRLAPEILDVYDTESTVQAALDDPDVEALLHTFERAPVFDAEQQSLPDAAARGTATHEFLQFCDLTRAEADLESELARLIELRFLPPEAARAIRMNELKRFFESDLFKDLKQALDLHRETRFNIFLPASDFTANEELKKELGGEKLLVQGVIDLFFTDKDGNLVLCDYKTDRLPSEVGTDPARAARFLFERHGTQLTYYKKALLALCGKEPDKTLIYSLPLGQALCEPQ